MLVYSSRGQVIISRCAPHQQFDPRQHSGMASSRHTYSSSASPHAKPSSNPPLPASQGTAGCYNGPSLLPRRSYCCDPLNAPPGCSTSQVASKFPLAVDFIGHPVNDAACSNQSAATPPGLAPGTPPPSPPSSTPSSGPSPSGPPSSPFPPPGGTVQGKGADRMPVSAWPAIAFTAVLAAALYAAPVLHA